MNSKQLSEVINSYCENEKPDYAIMVNGLWGSGKTYFIKNHFEEIKSHKIIFVSLYGVSSTSKIDDLIFSAMIGTSDVSDGEIKKAGDFIGKVFSSFGDKGEGSALGAFASAAGEAFKNRALKNIGAGTVLVFDDFERAEISAHQCLSKINEFVEHQKTKVIILCDESKVNDVKYSEYKEKVILHTNYLERTSKEITEICFSTTKFLSAKHVDLFKNELNSIIEEFSFTNIRTIMHGLTCFNKIINKLDELNFKHKNDGVLVELMFPALAYSAGYKDFSVDIADLERSSVEFKKQSVAYHMTEKKKDSKNELSNWAIFYEKILGKSTKRVEFKSIFELVCKGYLSDELLLSDMEKWEVKKLGPEHPICNFRVDEVISDNKFESNIVAALAILDDDDYVFYSTAELYEFCKNFIFLYEHGAFNYVGDFERKISSFALDVASKCLNHTDPSSFGYDKATGDVLANLYTRLEEMSKKFDSDNWLKTLQNDLLQSLVKNDAKMIKKLSHQASDMAILNIQNMPKIIKALPKCNNVTIRAFGIFLKQRYKTGSDFSNLSSEFEPLSDLVKGLKIHLDKTANSLSKMMIKLVCETSEIICNEANEYLRKEESKLKFNSSSETDSSEVTKRQDL